MSELSLATEPPPLLWKLWLYTNYDCNLKCSYCVAKSGPNVPRRALGVNNVQRLVDEAVALEFEHVFFTGGERGGSTHLFAFDQRHETRTSNFDGLGFVGIFILQLVVL